MAFEKPVLHDDRLATSSLATKQFYAVKLSSGQYVICATAGERCDGILQNAPAALEVASVMKEGITKAKAGGTIAEGDRVAVDANGKLVKATGGTYCVGTALEAAASDQVFSLHLGAQAGYIPLLLVASVYCDLALITSTAVEVMTDFTPGLADLVIEKFTLTVVEAVTTASKDVDFALMKNTAERLTGTYTALSANLTPLGKVVSQAITYSANALFDVNDTLSIDSPEVAAAFAEGEVQFNVYGRAGR